MEASVFGQGSKAGKQWKGEGDAETSERASGGVRGEAGTESDTKRSTQQQQRNRGQPRYGTRTNRGDQVEKRREGKNKEGKKG